MLILALRDGIVFPYISRIRLAMSNHTLTSISPSLACLVTGYTSPSGHSYILVMHEALWMPQLQHSLFNPNQFCHFGTIVQDNPYADTPMVVTSLGGDFIACLQTKGTDIFLKTWAPQALGPFHM